MVRELFGLFRRFKGEYSKKFDLKKTWPSCLLDLIYRISR